MQLALWPPAPAPLRCTAARAARTRFPGCARRSAASSRPGLLTSSRGGRRTRGRPARAPGHPRSARGAHQQLRGRLRVRAAAQARAGPTRSRRTRAPQRVPPHPSRPTRGARARYGPAPVQPSLERGRAATVSPRENHPHEPRGGRLRSSSASNRSASTRPVVAQHDRVTIGRERDSPRCAGSRRIASFSEWRACASPVSGEHPTRWARSVCDREKGRGDGASVSVVGCGGPCASAARRRRSVRTRP